MARLRNRARASFRAASCGAAAAFCVAACVLTASEPAARAPAGAATPATAAGAEAAPPSDWENRVHAALRRESSTQGAEQEQAIRDLVGLYQSLEKAKGIDQVERDELRSIVRNRLARVGQRIAKRLKNSNKPPAALMSAAKNSGSNVAAARANPTPSAAGKAAARPSTAKAGPKIIRTAPPLAQQLPAAPLAGVAPAAGAASADLTDELADLIRHVIAGDSWAEPGRAIRPFPRQIGLAAQMAPAGQRFGGQGQLAGGMGQGGQQPADYGQDLVELIEHTIAPGTWDVNGGNGTIMYYSPMRAIVVRQTDEVHEDLGGVLRGLRD
jgi:hypothetical protein